MPSLTWNGKSDPRPDPAALQTEALIFPAGRGYPEEQPRSRLLLGDNLGIMAALLPEWAGRINLIYTDPPFFTNRRFQARIGRAEDSRRPSEWRLSGGYQDEWNDLDAYLDFLYARLHLMHALLAPGGSLYLHLDWHADAYARLMLDEIFGPANLLNQIAWVYHGPSPIRSAFNRKHDTLLVYTKGKGHTFNADAVRVPYDPVTVKTFAASPRAGFGKVPDLARGKVPEDWWYFPVVARLHSERTGYPTQKPEALLERIILASSNPGDVVLDPFCGSGTTAVVAARLGRRFLCIDATWRAVHTTRARLAAAGAPPFSLERSSGAPWQLQAAAAGDYGLQRAGRSVLLPPHPDLDYWELDPDWREDCFRAAVQAAGPVRREPLPDRLELPEKAAGRRLCVRLVDVHGGQFQVLF